jgi:hypothetical protein
MKTGRDTTMPQIASRLSEVSQEHLEIFSELVELLKPYSTRLKARKNNTYQYELWTEHEHRPKSFHPRRKYGVLFAGISICKPHVGFYFYPLYLYSELRSRLSLELCSVLKGKSAFHFNSLQPSTFNQLKELLDEGFSMYDRKGWIVRRN